MAELAKPVTPATPAKAHASMNCNQYEGGERSDKCSIGEYAVECKRPHVEAN